jgi:hypothetical protein
MIIFQVSFPVAETSRACSVVMDFGKIFWSPFDFLSFYTARIINGPDGLENRLPFYTREAVIARRTSHVRNVPQNEPALRERAARGAEPVAPME